MSGITDWLGLRVNLVKLAWTRGCQRLSQTLWLLMQASCITQWPACTVSADAGHAMPHGAATRHICRVYIVYAVVGRGLGPKVIMVMAWPRSD
jgi:hypothetical protein